VALFVPLAKPIAEAIVLSIPLAPRLAQTWISTFRYFDSASKSLIGILLARKSADLFLIRLLIESAIAYSVNLLLCLIFLLAAL